MLKLKWREIVFMILAHKLHRKSWHYVFNVIIITTCILCLTFWLEKIEIKKEKKRIYSYRVGSNHGPLCELYKGSCLTATETAHWQQLSKGWLTNNKLVFFIWWTSWVQFIVHLSFFSISVVIWTAAFFICKNKNKLYSKFKPHDWLYYYNINNLKKWWTV